MVIQYIACPKAERTVAVQLLEQAALDRHALRALQEHGSKPVQRPVATADHTVRILPL